MNHKPEAPLIDVEFTVQQRRTQQPTSHSTPIYEPHFHHHLPP